MKCLIIDVVHESIAEELGKYMQVDTHMLPTQGGAGQAHPGLRCAHLAFAAWTPRSPEITDAAAT